VRHLVFLPAALAALALVPAANAVGPSLPALDGASIAATTGGLSYVTRLSGLSTRIEVRAHGQAVRTRSVAGSWGIQLATLTGAMAGLSPNGRVLVLSDNVQANGDLRDQSRFAVVDTRTLAVVTTIKLAGDYSVDALSPQGDTLYLIHHVSRADATKYQVQAYDLTAGRLLPGVIADKSQAGWIMAGYPVARATDATGRWVYTFYRQDRNFPFVHALDTINHVAVCIGLSAKWGEPWLSSAKLRLAGGKLEIKTSSGETRFRLDTTTFRISTP
jgi:hypothetical protein